MSVCRTGDGAHSKEATLATISFYRDGLKLLNPGPVVIAAMKEAVDLHGIDPEEIAGIARRLIADEDAREMFEELTGLEVVCHD